MSDKNEKMNCQAHVRGKRTLCSNKARPGKLTCGTHYRLETNVRDMMKSREGN